MGSHFKRSGTGRGSLPKVRVRSRDSPRSPGRVVDPLGVPGTVGGPSRMSKTGQKGLRKERDGSGGPSVGQGLVEGPFQRFGTGRGTLTEFREGLGDPPGGLEWVGGPNQKFGTGWGPSWRSGMGWGPSQNSGTGQETIPEVWNESGDPTRGLRRIGVPCEGPGWV